METKFLDKIIFRKFKIIKPIGKGEYSKVFLAKNIINKNFVALKIAEKIKDFGSLEKEAYYLYQLKGKGIPKIISYGHYGKYDILVEQLLGKTIHDLFQENKDKNSRLKDIIMATIQLIDRIKFIHSKNLLHLDIKPKNFLVGNPDSFLIYAIDFGFAKKYRSSRTGKHIQIGKNKYFKGNLKYSTARSMRGIETSRRDDLESLGFMIIDLYTHQLPWNILNEKNKFELAKKIYSIKKNIPIEILCRDSPIEIYEYMKYVNSLKFEEEPKYEYLKNIFVRMLQKFEIFDSFHFSWVNQSYPNKKINSLNNSSKSRKIGSFYKLLKNYNFKSVSNVKILSPIKDNFKTIEDEEDKKYSTSRKKESPNNVVLDNYENIRENNKNFKSALLNDEIKINDYNKINMNNLGYISIKNNFNKPKKNHSIFNNYGNNKSDLSYSNLNSNNNSGINLSYGNNISIQDSNFNSKIENNNQINFKYLISNVISNKTYNIYTNNPKKVSVNLYPKNIEIRNYEKKNIKKYNSFNKLNNNLDSENNDEIYNFIEKQKNSIESFNNNNFYSNIDYKRKFIK